MKKRYLLVLFLLGFISCSDDDRVEIDESLLHGR